MKLGFSIIPSLLLRAQRSVNDDERDRLYKQAAQVIRDDMPKIPFDHTTPPLVARNYVQGYVTNPTGTEFFKTVTVDR